VIGDAQGVGGHRAGRGSALHASQSKQFLPNTVMYTLATAGYVPFVLNLHESMKRVGMAEYLVVYTPNEAVQHELQAYGLRCLCFGEEELPDQGDWFSPEFAHIVALKFAVASEILISGRNALFVDADIVFLRNPADYLRELTSRSPAKMIMQYEAPKGHYNTGFWFARPHPAIIRLFYDICTNLIDKSFCDQTCFNQLVRRNDLIQVEALDPELFACGNQFLGRLSDAPETIDRSTRPFDFGSAYLLHFNYLTGKRRKVNAIKECNSLFYPGLLENTEAKRPLWSRLSGYVRRVSGAIS
jgi:Nucleotide-diphospho-sugar transferase